MKMNKLKQTTKIVKEILQRYPETRSSDNLLYIKVCERVNNNALHQPFWQVLASLKEMNLPGFETVRRSRQKLQATYPELAGSSNVEAQRKVNEDIFREYAKGRC